MVETANQFVADVLVFRGYVPGVQQGGFRVPVVLKRCRQQAQSSPHPLKVGVVGQPLLNNFNDAGMKGVAVVEVPLFPGVMGSPAAPQVGVGPGSLSTGRLVPPLKQPLPQDGGQVSILGGNHIVAGAGDNGIHFRHSLGQYLGCLLKGVIPRLRGSDNQDGLGAFIHSGGQGGDSRLDAIPVRVRGLQSLGNPLHQLIHQD